MIVYNSLEEIKDIKSTVIALGNFDGVHRGHQELIRRAVKSAEAAGFKSAVFTFSNHPRNLLGNGNAVKNIMYCEDKAHIIGNLGIDYMFNIPFTDENYSHESHQLYRRSSPEHLQDEGSILWIQLPLRLQGGRRCEGPHGRKPAERLWDSRVGGL